MNDKNDLHTLVIQCANRF